MTFLAVLAANVQPVSVGGEPILALVSSSGNEHLCVVLVLEAMPHPPEQQGVQASIKALLRRGLVGEVDVR